MKSLLAYMFVVLYGTTLSVVLVTAFFWILTLYTQIPVDNNALWIGMCIIVAGLYVAGAAALSSKRKRDGEHDS